MERKVAELEECNGDHAEMLTYTLNFQQTIQARLTDLEANHAGTTSVFMVSSRGLTGDNTKTFLEELFKHELYLINTNFNI